MSVDHLVCVFCDTRHEIETVPSKCRQCGGILDLRLGDAGACPGASDDPRSLWSWAEYLPHCGPEHRITLGEAGSPCLKADRLAVRHGLSDLWIKADSVMPTGSFKDRAVALATALACEFDRPAMVMSSSGNAGAAGAAYAARAGKPIVVLVPKTAPEAKLGQIAVTGARLIPVDGPTSACCQLAEALARDRGWVNLTTTYHNPYGVDAYATMAYELAATAPDVLLLPISSGPLLAGIMKGFARLHAAGRIAKVPRPIAIQAEACAPIAKAFDERGGIRPWAHATTIASALNDTLDGYEHDGDYTLSFIRAHGGAAIAVRDDEVLAGIRMAATLEGLVLEPSAAITVGALDVLRRRDLISDDERVVIVATGHGLKDLSHVEVASSEAISPSQDALTARLDRDVVAT